MKAKKAKTVRPTKRATRVQRPELPRTEPVRTWSGIFGPDAAASTARNGRPAQTVQRGVELGYRVIDEYIKQGAAVANAFGGPRRAHAPSGQDLPKMTQRMMQYASDFTALWFDAMNMMMQTVEQQQGQNDTPAARAEPQTRLVIALHASKPVDVLATFDRPLTGELAIEPPGKRDKLIDIAIEPRSDPAAPLKLSVRVANQVRPGRYTRALLDARSDHPAGRVTVTVGA